MISVKEVIVVEGRYDKNTLSQVFDAVIVETSGFGVFKDREKLALLRRLAEARGLVILTDSDGAGQVIRNYLKGAIDPALVKMAYVPELPGKERRKSRPSKEGKLGVEGMEREVLIDGPAPGGRHAGRRGGDAQDRGHHEGDAVRAGPERRRGQRGKAAGAAPAAGPAGETGRQRAVGRAERPLRRGEPQSRCSSMTAPAIMATRSMAWGRRASSWASLYV